MHPGMTPSRPGGPWGGAEVALSGLERRVLELARDGVVLEEPESAPAVNAVYRSLNRRELLEAHWWPRGELPLSASITPAGKMLLRKVRLSRPFA
ncbi:hypothetical protein GCM10027519_07580 [Kineococcus endophyticus]